MCAVSAGPAHVVVFGSDVALIGRRLWLESVNIYGFIGNTGCIVPRVGIVVFSVHSRKCLRYELQDKVLLTIALFSPIAVHLVDSGIARDIPFSCLYTSS